MILFHDVDGCLNAHGGADLDFTGAKLSQAEAAALSDLGNRLDQSPVDHLVINTGRSWAATRHLCKAISSTKARYAVTEHGAEVWDVADDTSIDLTALAREFELAPICRALKGVHRVHELIAWFQTIGCKLVSEAASYSGRLQHQRDKTSNLTIPIPASVSGDVLFAAVQSAIRNEQRFADDKFIFHHSRSAGFIDVMSQVDKGMGVALVTQFLAGDPTQTIAIGDGLNDLPMLRAVSYPICPANADPEVQAFCATNGHNSAASYIAATTTWLARLDDR